MDIETIITALTHEDTITKVSGFLDQRTIRRLPILCEDDGTVVSGRETVDEIDRLNMPDDDIYDALSRLSAFDEYQDDEWFWDGAKRMAERILGSYQSSILMARDENEPDNGTFVFSHWDPSQLDALKSWASRDGQTQHYSIHHSVAGVPDYLLLNLAMGGSFKEGVKPILLKGIRTTKGSDDISLLLVEQKKPIPDKEVRTVIGCEIYSVYGRDYISVARCREVSSEHYIKRRGIFSLAERTVHFDD